MKKPQNLMAEACRLMLAGFKLAEGKLDTTNGWSPLNRDTLLLALRYHVLEEEEVHEMITQRLREIDGNEQSGDGATSLTLAPAPTAINSARLLAQLVGSRTIVYYNEN